MRSTITRRAGIRHTDQPTAAERAAFIAMHGAGKPMAKIAKAFNLSGKLANEWRKSVGLPARKGKHTEPGVYVPDTWNRPRAGLHPGHLAPHPECRFEDVAVRSTGLAMTTAAVRKAYGAGPEHGGWGVVEYGTTA